MKLYSHPQPSTGWLIKALTKSQITLKDRHWVWEKQPATQTLVVLIVKFGSVFIKLCACDGKSNLLSWPMGNKTADSVTYDMYTFIHQEL